MFAHREIFHGDVVLAVKGIDVIDLENAGVGQARRNPCLANEALGEVLVCAHGGVHELDRHLAIKIEVQGTVDRGHTASAQALIEFVAR